MTPRLKRVDWLAADRDAKRFLADDDQPDSGRRIEGGHFIFDTTARTVAPWGDGERMLWASGEPFMVFGPTGVGKSTLIQHVAFRRVGLLSGDFLGFPVQLSEGRVLYIAADRPNQLARSMRRLVKSKMREALDRKLEVWRGPLPFDLGTCERGTFAEWISTFSEISDVVVDSVKDVAMGLSSDEVGARVNNEYQLAIAAGYELISNHHPRKGQVGNAKPKKIDDVFGSAWLVAGHGSVVSISQGSFLVGDFALGATLFMREAVQS